MLAILLFFGISVTCSFGGEVSVVGYDPNKDYWYAWAGKEYGKTFISGSRSFYLTVQPYRHLNTRAYRNTVILHYDYYRLEKLMVPSIKELEEADIDDSIVASVKPITPSTESYPPYEITVYYSMTNYICRYRIYQLQTYGGQYYHWYSSGVADNSKCNK